MIAWSCLLFEADDVCSIDRCIAEEAARTESLSGLGLSEEHKDVQKSIEKYLVLKI